MSAAGVLFVMRDASVGVTNAFKSTFLRFCWSFCAVFVLLWVAVMMYITFYYAYMPTVRHVYPVHLQFKTDCDKAIPGELCSYPEGNVTFSTGERMLMRGQRYQVFLDLDMPHSEVNEKLGMFMVQVKFVTSTGAILSHSSRSCMLHYKSGLLRSLSTLFLSVPMLTGFLEEKQTVPVQLHENYIEDSYRPAVSINVVILARKIELYSASLRIEALFTGLRFIMFSWPGTSALLGVTCNFIAISVIFFFAYSAFTPDPFCEESDTEDNVEEIANVTDEPQSQPVIRRQNSSEDCRRRSSTSQAPAVISNGRCKPIGSKHRSYKVRKTPQSAPLPPHDYDCSEGLLRSATFPPYRWDCKGECEKPRACMQDTALWTTPIHQTRSSTNRSSSLSSGDGCVVRSAHYEPITCATGGNDRVTSSAELHKGEDRLEQASTNANRLTTWTSCCHRESCTQFHANCALSPHSEIVENGSIFCEEHRDFVIDKKHEPLEARHIRKLADGECGSEYRPSYYGTSICSRKLSQSSLSSEEHIAVEHSIPCAKVAQCAICGAGHTEGAEYAPLICSCRATKVYASTRPFKGRVPDGAPAQEEPSVQQVIGNINGKQPGTSEVENAKNVAAGDKYNTDPKSESLSKETSAVDQGRVNCDLAKERKLKRRSVDKSRASFKLSLKKMISMK